MTNASYERRSTTILISGSLNNNKTNKKQQQLRVSATITHLEIESITNNNASYYEKRL